MKKLLVALGAAMITSTVAAEIPQFRASCPTGILAAGGGSAVFINGHQAHVKETGANSFIAKKDGIELDFVFAEGEPSMSYSAPGGAHGICSVNKFRPAAPKAAQGGNNAGGANPGKMSAECKGYASEKFGVRPSYVQVHPAFRDHGMFSMYGNADSHNFICSFSADGKFVGVDSTGNPDGDL